MSSRSVPGCPNQGGLLDSITVPVGQPLNLAVVIGGVAPPGGAQFQLSSANPAFVAAGDPRQGFLPIVTIPEGSNISNLFTIFGISVGQTQLRITPLTPGFIPSAFPLGAWDVNKSGAGANQKFLDTNDPGAPCRDSGSPNLTTTASLQSTCGKPVKGVASDGVNALLLRTLSGLGGTACYEITSTSSLDQGTIQTPLTTTQAVSGLNYGFSYYMPPAFYGDNSASRNVTVEFTFTPNIGNGNTSTLQATFAIVRPPVMLLHGLWSDSSSWNKDFVRNDATHSTNAGDYKSTNAASFSTNQSKVQGFIADALKLIRQKGYAATQADVVGHSMGGLLSRLFAGSGNYMRPENFNKGDIHRLVTLDTPHWGSNFANLLVELHRANPTQTESTVTALTGGSATAGAVCDLSENSPALQGLSGGTNVMSQVITATGGPAGSPASPAKFWGGATIFGVKSFESALTAQYCTNWTVDPLSGTPICTAFAFYFPQATVDAFRFRELNDAVVPLSSEGGGLGGINFTAYIHFHIPGIPGVQRGITDGSDVAARTFQTLDGPNGGLAGSLPGVPSDGTGKPKTVPGRGTPLDQQDYASQCGAGGPMKTNSLPKAPIVMMSRAAGPETPAAADPRVNLISPAAGTSFTQGDNMTMVIELSPPLTVSNTVGATITGLTHVTATWTSGLRFSATFQIPPLVAGPLTITPDFTDTMGNTFTGTPVTVGVKPASAPVALAFQQNNFLVTPGSGSRQLYLMGTFGDGSQLDLSSTLAGTSYSTSNPAVLTVDGEGLVTLAGQGFGTITGRNSGLADFATFVVEDPQNPLPPANLTNQVTITKSGFRLDRNTGFYVQDISLTNTSGVPLPASLYMVFSGLTNGVTLVNKSGLTAAIQPVGSSFVNVDLPGDGLTLPPGATFKVTLQFLNANRVSINYTLSLFRTSVAP